MSETGTEL